MPTTTENQYVIDVVVSGGTASDVYINLKNGNTGDIVHRLTSTNEANINLGNQNEFPNGFQNGDVIEINASGRRTGGTTHTVDTSKGGKKVKLTLTDVSTTNAPQILI